MLFAVTGATLICTVPENPSFHNTYPSEDILPAAPEIPQASSLALICQLNDANEFNPLIDPLKNCV